VQRTVEVPRDKGFGFNELFRAEDGPFTGAVQVKRIYRRAFDAQGDKEISGARWRRWDGVPDFHNKITQDSCAL
jgi:hypothetical protein